MIDTQARLLEPGELERAGGFWLEVRTQGGHTDIFFHTVDEIKDEIVHMTCSVGYVVGYLDNYNIGWRAWLLRPSDEQRRAEPWAPIVQSKGIGYGWDCPRMAEKHHCKYFPCHSNETEH